MRISLIEFHRWHMERFVAECNINRFEQLLREASDPSEQRLLEELLAEERLKLSHIAGPEIAEPARGLLAEATPACRHHRPPVLYRFR